MEEQLLQHPTCLTPVFQRSKKHCWSRTFSDKYNPRAEVKSPLTPTKKSAFGRQNCWIFLLGGRRCARYKFRVDGRILWWAKAQFFGEVFLESTQKMVPKNLLGCYLKSLSNLGGSFEIKDLKCLFFFLKCHRIQEAKWFENLRFGKDNSRPSAFG